MCVWILAYCQESKEEAMLRLVNEWNGKEIKFPSHSIFTVLGKDTVDFSFVDADYKVLTYIDSAGCASCKLQFPRWKRWIHEVDSLTDGKVPFLFYFHPKDLKELRYLTRLDDFTYPVCFDEKDELNQLNRFPLDMTFQTFLLDRNNRVVAIGNPIYNPRVKELYLDLIIGKESTKTTDTNMKKNIRAVMMITVFALVGGVNVYNTQKKVEMSDVALANVEALASDGESSGIPWQGFLYDSRSGCCAGHTPYAECSGAYTAC